MALTSSDFGKGGLFGKGWLSGLQAAYWRRGNGPRHGAAHLPSPSITGGLPTVPALACAGLLGLGVQLTLGQFGEADADGGHGLHVVHLHDVAEEPHPKPGGV